MGNSKLWRFCDHMPVSVQATLLFISLILVLSSVTYHMLPTSSWGDNFGNLLLGVTWVSTIKNNTLDNTRTSHNLMTTPGAPVEENLYYPQQASKNFTLSAPFDDVDDVTFLLQHDEGLSVSEAPGGGSLPHIETALPPNLTETGSSSSSSEVSNATRLVAPTPVRPTFP